jgi:hypothetical protein
MKRSLYFSDAQRCIPTPTGITLRAAGIGAAANPAR